MCEHGKTKRVRVKIPSDLSHTGEEYFALKEIDFCIADLVQALNNSQVWTRASCCGHNKKHGEIILQDGRTLIVV
jgi:hypothetical protein